MAIKPGSLHEPAHHQDPHEPDWWQMSEAQIAARLMRQEAGSMFDMADNLAPPGWRYQWFVYSVNNQPDRDTIALAESNGWKTVAQSRHDGIWMPPGTEGPTMYRGQMLMELPEPVYKVKQKLDARAAAAQRDSLMDRMSYTPTGGAPRTAPTLNHKVIEAGEFEISVER